MFFWAVNALINYLVGKYLPQKSTIRMKKYLVFKKCTKFSDKNWHFFVINTLIKYLTGWYLFQMFIDFPKIVFQKINNFFGENSYFLDMLIRQLSEVVNYYPKNHWICWKIFKKPQNLLRKLIYFRLLIG